MLLSNKNYVQYISIHFWYQLDIATCYIICLKDK